MPFALPPLAHVGIVVADLERAAADYERRWGVTTEQVQDLALDDARLHGKQAGASARYGFISTGASQIELIQPLSAPLAVYRVPDGQWRRRRPSPRLHRRWHRPVPGAPAGGRRNCRRRFHDIVHLSGNRQRSLHLYRRPHARPPHRADRDDRRFLLVLQQ